MDYFDLDFNLRHCDEEMLSRSFGQRGVYVAVW
jgi:hypothetical protein